MEEVRIAIGKDGEKEISSSIKKKLLKLIETVRTLDFYQEEKTVSCLNQLEVDLRKEDESKKKKTFNDIKESIDAFEKATDNMLSNWIYGVANQLELA
jgi:Ulp1 family protease